MYKTLRQQGSFLPIIGVIVLILILCATTYYLGRKSVSTEVVQPASYSPSPSTTTTLPPSNQDETNQWKTYSYPDFGYSFKLPAVYKININQPNPTVTEIIQSLNLNKADANLGPNDLTVSVWSKDVDATLKRMSEDGFKKTGTKVLNGKEWTTASRSQELVYLIQNNNKTYVISGKNIPFLEQVLGTFKFI